MMKLAQIGFFQLRWDGKLKLLIHLDMHGQKKGKKKNAQEVIREEVEQVVEEIQIEENECQSCTNLKHQVEKNADEISSLKEEIRLLKEKKSSLESEVIGLKKRPDASTLNAECLENNKSKLKFYTGM